MQHLFGKVVHTAFVVPDFDAAIGRMLDSGFGPAFLLRRLAQPGFYRGARHDMVMNVAFFAVGDTFFEYIEQLDESPSAYREFLDRQPEGGMHHIAYYSEDFDADIARAKAAGVALEVVEALLMPDGSLMEYYLQPAGQSGAVMTQLMYGGPNVGTFARMEEIARNWDGRDPVRDLFDLMPAEMPLGQA